MKKCRICKKQLTVHNTYPSQLEHREYICKPCNNIRTRPYRIKAVRSLKKEIILKYGGKCKCCGEEEFEFLTIDHKNGGGIQHRRQLEKHLGYKNGHVGGSYFYRWLKKNNFPRKDFQLLCANCNFAKGHYGYCPHKKGAK